MSSSAATPLLIVDGLRTWFRTEDGVAKAVDGVSYNILPGETLALVGESGCGKSVSALSILRLVPSPPGRIEAGRVLFRDRNLLDLDARQMRHVRGNEIAMIFQEPMTSLNPVYTIGEQIVEAVELHQGIKGKAAWDKAVESLRAVGIPAPEQRVREYPHQLSGGMRQRAMIAMALSCDPALLIADEPTTALDVTIQAQILELLKELQRTKGLSILLITHDLGVVAENADRVAVMYASKIVEFAEVNELFSNPLHPYTEKLFASIPRLGERKTRLDVIPGNVPDPLHFPGGCKFHPRCHRCGDDSRCINTEAELREVRPGHWVACWKVDGFVDAPESTPNAAIAGFVSGAEQGRADSCA
ncbi:MAG: Oligopeptide transport ATP-binding protein OppD [Phycisphaerae bacterium]|nr:Oligopeptide transport ATP-binding protein OppD [Phycisphaerae bacterium]